jgi:hypothetical protein
MSVGACVCLCSSDPAQRLESLDKLDILFAYRLHCGGDDRLRPFAATLKFQPQVLGNANPRLVEVRACVCVRVCVCARAQRYTCIHRATPYLRRITLAV